MALSIEMVIQIVIGVAVMVVILVFGGPIITSILKALGISQIAGGPTNDFERAIQCSYIRCAEGCISTSISSDCYTQACAPVPEEFKTNDPTKKICGSNAEQYPVQVDVSSRPSIDRNNLASIGSTHCIITQDSSSTGVSAVDEHFVYVDKNLLTSVKTTDECAGRRITGGTALDNTIETAKVVIPGKIAYLSTTHGCPVPWCFGWDDLFTRIAGEANYFNNIAEGQVYSISLDQSEFTQPLTTEQVNGQDTAFGKRLRLIVKDSSTSTEGFIWVKSFNTGVNPVCGIGVIFTVNFDGLKSDYRGCQNFRQVHGALVIEFTNLGGSKTKLSVQYLPALGVGKTVLYQDDNFGGKAVEVGQDISDLGTVDLNDKISSLKVGRNTKVIIYENINYGGESASFTADTTQLAKTVGPCDRFTDPLTGITRPGHWNNCASSLKIQST